MYDIRVTIEVEQLHGGQADKFRNRYKQVFFFSAIFPLSQRVNVGING